MASQRSIGVVAAVSDEYILETNLQRSPVLDQGLLPHYFVRGALSAAEAYNRGIEYFSDKELVVLVHQDVYLPLNWVEQLSSQLDQIELAHNDWGVLGVFGKTIENKSIGRLWDTGLNTELGGSFFGPLEVESLDELVLVVKPDNHLLFDENMGGFHLFAMDFCETARVSGKKAYVLHAPVIHNSKRIQSLGGAYASAYRYLQKKWRHRLPLYSVCSPVTKWGLTYQRMRFGLARRRLLGRLPVTKAGSIDPVLKARELGYE